MQCGVLVYQVLFVCLCRLPAETTFASDVSEKTDSDSTVVTVVTRESASVIDDVQSLFSVDQDGFFTSMHTDSGLAGAGQPVNNSARLVTESSSSTDVNSSRNTSVETKSFDIRSRGGNDSPDLASVTALTMQMSSSFALHMSDNKLDIDNKSEIERCRQNMRGTVAENDPILFRCPSVGQSVTGAYPSFCTVTPPSSEDETVADETDNSDWSERCSILSPSAAVSTPLPTVVITSEHDKPPDVSLVDSYTLPTVAKVQTAETNSDGKFSTWPCSPVPGSSFLVRGILKSKSVGKQCQQVQKSTKFSPVVSPGEEASYSCKQMNMNSESHSKVNASSASSVSFSFNQNQACDVEDSSSGNVLLSSNDGTNLLTEQTSSEGSALNENKVGETLAVEASTASDLSTSDAGIPAAIVISSPVIMQSTYVENTHRRLVCRSVRPDEWYKFGSYTGKHHWNSTMPRNSHLARRTANKFGTERRRRSNTERPNVQRCQQDDSQLTDCTVCVAQQQSDAIAPVTMFNSPRRYGIDRRKESLQANTSTKADDPAVPNCRKVAAKAASTTLSGNVSELGDKQHTSSSSLSVQHSTNVPQLSSKGKEVQKPTLRLMSEDICENKNAQSGKDVIHSPCQSSVCQQGNSVGSGVIHLPNVELQTANNTCTSVELDHTVNSDACATLTTDTQEAVDSDSMQMLNVNCSQLRISSAAVYNTSGDRDSLARSSDSISSVLSAAERSRAAKLTFLGFRLGQADQTVVNCANMNHNTCIFPAHTEDTSLSCSSSGLGSSVSGSPVVSPDDDALNDVNQTSADPACVSCNGPVAKYNQQLLDCPVKYKRTVLLSDQSRQTAV